MQDFRLEIITGMSGAGKSQVIRLLEDLGFYCVDNLPPVLISQFTDLVAQSLDTINRVALVIDIRGGEFFSDLFKALADLRANKIRYEIFFLEASEETLVRRFKETRRRHPMVPSGRVLEGIRKEREYMQELRGLADKIIDTSNMTNTQLKDRVLEMFCENKQDNLSITIMSFGYKYGLPIDADLTMDVRFLPNPFYLEELRALTGHQHQVRDYVLQNPAAKTFVKKYVGLLDFLLPHYAIEGKAHLMIAIGCTGGQHRSVSLVNRISYLLSKKGYQVTVRHRDINRAVVKKESMKLS